MESLAADARRLLEAAWRADTAGGFCVPNAVTYPWQWLWDSCFHAVVWAHLGDERAIAELHSALSVQAEDGFVPHLRYGDGPSPHADLWGRSGASTITQPPMYGHAVAELVRLGLAPSDEVVDRSHRGLAFLLRQRRRSPAGLVEVCHPWESGCDDSPRWDDAIPGSSAAARYRWKGDLVASIEWSSRGTPLHNAAFAVGSAGFSALVAWNAMELAAVTGDDELRGEASELAEAIDERWDAELVTWVDDGSTAAGSGATRTLDALLPVLLRPRADALSALVDPGAFGAPYGPRGVHAAEPTYDPTAYWRGSAWPQLGYVLWVASTRSGSDEARSALARSIVAGASRSGYAEHWAPDTAAPLGAVPQSWSTLALAVAAGR
ncbi:MAG: MGH1-like glycoside hydrolase domain-containing protein [Acidimicrobiales bacterium]